MASRPSAKVSPLLLQDTKNAHIRWSRQGVFCGRVFVARDQFEVRVLGGGEELGDVRFGFGIAISISIGLLVRSEIDFDIAIIVAGADAHVGVTVESGWHDFVTFIEITS